MEVLNELKELLIGAIPTFLLVWILYLYVTRVFYGPLEKTLRKRREATSGLRKTAEAEIVETEKKTAQYQEALRTVKTELYHVQEQERQRVIEQRGEILRQAHQRAEVMVQTARQQIRQEAGVAKMTLDSEAEQLAASITQAILKSAALAPRAGKSETAP